ncbi:hypothetical protein TPHA_0A02850 [Tetrapisispora phaffii CBS 4417]|uniref:RING-type domain-containing protein n=1 Tax=Tetrapisispora phaffii (strain ATCC 24235 / CBS 4417 / NBRC 1672 / NRRL Y-8282 / UCD 70-5) TaxID=1071381 RepID=G8BN88_TETPH|nr:hypothetical protein TPHA_0A02850 [Tetrapisispora phaffii CBS 4417]CCE61366.1 hypothetical protein TPHA_0A02850 [Tetrapisispora phaffii CBS 4417]
MNILRTPSRASNNSEKVLHTPPSIHHDVFGSNKQKFMKGLSGKVIRKSPNKNLNKITTPKPLTPPSSVKSKKLNKPPPLKLNNDFKIDLSTNKKKSIKKYNPLTSSPQPQQSVNLLSPIPLMFTTNSKKIEGITPLNSNLLKGLFEPTKITSVDQMVIGGDDDLQFMSDESPTLLLNAKRSSSRNFSNRSEAVKVQNCSICEECMSLKLNGEKVIELDCGHVSHYECYNSVFTSTSKSTKTPQCSFCLEASLPKDEDVMEKLVSNSLIAESPTFNVPMSTTSIKKQWLNPTTPTNNSISLQTPYDQLIQTADITTNGFISANSTVRNSILTGTDDTQFMFNLIKGVIKDYSEDPSTYQLLDITEDRQEKDVDLKLIETPDNFKLKLQFNDSLGDSEEEDILYSDEATNELKDDIVKQVTAQLNLRETYGELLMFDKVKYSKDGENWNSKITVLYFTKYLILFDNFEMKVSGKLPVSQIFQAKMLNHDTVIMDLMSTSVPEIYFCFDEGCNNSNSNSSNNNNSNSESLTDEINPTALKWKYYIENAGKHIEIPPQFITHNALDILSQDLQKNLVELKARGDARKEWLVNYNDTTLQLIVCINVSTKGDITEYKKRLTEMLNGILSKLNADDKFGLVILGQDGDGIISEAGKYIGLINNEWCGWREIIEELEITNEEIFSDNDKIILKALETSCKLLSANHFDLPSDDHESERLSNSARNVLILANDASSIGRDGLAKKYEERLEIDFSCQVQIMSLKTLERSMDYFIDDLHRKKFQNIVVHINDGKTFRFGNMSSGEIKYCKYEIANISDLITDRKVILTWFDLDQMRTIKVQKNLTITSTA